MKKTYLLILLCSTFSITIFSSQKNNTNAHLTDEFSRDFIQIDNSQMQEQNNIASFLNNILDKKAQLAIEYELEKKLFKGKNEEIKNLKFEIELHRTRIKELQLCCEQKDAEINKLKSTFSKKDLS